MLDFITKSIFAIDGMTTGQFFICLGAALVLGAALAFMSLYKNNPSKSFLLTLFILPLCVEIIIMLVNRSIGTGLAIAGTFSLLRFRSVPASARDIVTLLIGTVIGFTLGRGLIYISVIFTVICFLVILLASNIKIGGAYSDVKMLRVTVPEDLEYENMFDDIFTEYTTEHVLEYSKTTNMGALYELKYRVALKKGVSSKEFMDKIRVRNGNLTVCLGDYTLDKKDML